MKGCSDISQNSLYSQAGDILICCFSEFVISKVVTKNELTTILLEYKGFHQFSLCQYLDIEPFRAAHLGFIRYFESGVFPRAKFNAENVHRQTVLFVAAHRGQPRVVVWLLKNGADINRVDGNGGRTALHAACRAKNKVIAEILLRAGADRTIRSKRGLTAEEENPSFFAGLLS